MTLCMTLDHHQIHHMPFLKVQTKFLRVSRVRWPTKKYNKQHRVLEIQFVIHVPSGYWNTYIVWFLYVSSQPPIVLTYQDRYTFHVTRTVEGFRLGFPANGNNVSTGVFAPLPLYPMGIRYWKQENLVCSIEGLHGNAANDATVNATEKSNVMEPFVWDKISLNAWRVFPCHFPKALSSENV